jgi:hypothetical protein
MLKNGSRRSGEGLKIYRDKAQTLKKTKRGKSGPK